MTPRDKMMRREGLVQKLEEACPVLKKAVDALADKWLRVVVESLDAGEGKRGFPKVFNDPVWGTIELLPWEVLLLDSPLVQRLRGVRQLGLAHYVYPGAGHDRLEHARGVVEAASRMLDKLSHNAEHRRRFGIHPDTSIPDVSDVDRYVVRLAALLHDLGHGPFSHAIEPVIEQRYSGEFKNLAREIRSVFTGVGTVSVSEGIAVLLVLSPAMQRVLMHNEFCFAADKSDLAMRLVARIVGGRSHLSASYLSGIVSDPVDADKLDYMARDGHHAGLSVGLDTDRLISKLEVITITPDNVPPRLSDLRDRAEAAPQRRVYDMGISQSGIGAYEQMIVGRVVLYDRLYYHHKVRAADAMAQRLVQIADDERGRPFTLEELFFDVSDDTLVEVLGGRLSSSEMSGGQQRARDLAIRIRERRLYYRALAFAARFVAGIEGFQDDETRDSERAALWRQVTMGLATFEEIRAFEQEIFEVAKEVAHLDEHLKASMARLRPEHIIVDLPANKAQPSGNLLLTRIEDDQVGIPNLFFDPEKWSNAYDQQKRCGYVFSPREHIPLVSFAARIALFRRFRLGMSEIADRTTKTTGLVRRGWIEELAKAGVIDAECYQQLRGDKVFLSRILLEDIRIPADWAKDRPELAKYLAEEISICRPGGFVKSVKEALVQTVDGVAKFVQRQVEGGEYSKEQHLLESKLQADLRGHLRTLGLDVREGSEVGGGETDLIAQNVIVIENKVAKETDDPMSESFPYPFQARRYTVALCQSIFLTMVAYKPKTEKGILPQSQSVDIHKVPDVPGDCVEIRFVIPYGASRPSEAKAPV
jgi:HD superfamily phosphohydrolase